MSHVGVVHMDLGSKGGGEAVTMCLLEALQDDYELTLLTLTEPDIDGLNAYYDTDVDDDAVTVRRAGRLATGLHRRFGFKYYVLQNALLARYARRHSDEFELLVSTINELGLPAGSIEYVHFPFDWSVNLTNRGDIFHPTIEDGSLYERLCTLVAGVCTADLEENTIFANSDWTADRFRAAYGIQPDVLYPPVDTGEFTDRPWGQREDGFVCIGRLEESKRIVEIIGIVDALRDRGHDVHLHIVGPTYDERYRARLESLAATRPHVEIEGELPRSTLVDLICSHRYGIHGKEHEHFGMAVAEFVAGGAIPFIPASGGQSAIVGEDERLLYETPTDAVEKIDAVLSDRALQRELRADPAEIERRFGRDRFKARIRTAVAKAIGRPVPRTDPPSRPAVIGQHR